MDQGHVEVIAGVNLPMLVKLASMRTDHDLAALVAAAPEAGRKYISVASQVLSGQALSDKALSGQGAVGQGAVGQGLTAWPRHLTHHACAPSLRSATSVACMPARRRNSCNARKDLTPRVTVTRDGERVPATSIMGLLMLAAGPGARIEIVATGVDAEAAVEALSALVSCGFNE